MSTHWILQRERKLKPLNPYIKSSITVLTTMRKRAKMQRVTWVALMHHYLEEKETKRRRKTEEHKATEGTERQKKWKWETATLFLIGPAISSSYNKFVALLPLKWTLFSGSCFREHQLWIHSCWNGYTDDANGLVSELTKISLIKAVCVVGEKNWNYQCLCNQHSDCFKKSFTM